MELSPGQCIGIHGEEFFKLFPRYWGIGSTVFPAQILNNLRNKRVRQIGIKTCFAFMNHIVDILGYSVIFTGKWAS